MKRILSLLMAAVLCLLPMAACSGQNESSSADGFSSASLVIVYKGKSYSVNKKVDSIRAALGEPAETVAQQSCHYSENGDEYWLYYYFGEGKYDAESGNDADMLSIHTVPLKAGSDTICDIECHTNKATTDKGLTVGSTMEEMINAYGNGYIDEGDGFYTYYDGEALPTTPRLMFHIVDNLIDFFAVSAAINI